MPRVMGVDAAKGGWFGLVLDPAGHTAHVAGGIAELVALAEAGGPLDAIGIDIPIGLPDRSRRRADELARQAVGPRRVSSVYLTPVRAALAAGTHDAAVARNRELIGEGVSIQAYGLRERIFEVDQWVRGQPRRVVEVHPELSFATMAGEPLADSKMTWAGVELRRQLLADWGIWLGPGIGRPGAQARVDDVLDAAAAAWSAQRVAMGTAVRRPDPPEVFSDGWLSAIYT